MNFWITAIGLTLITGIFLARALTRGRADEDQSPAAFDLQVYRDQLAEVDRDLARGVIAQEDADRVRTEVSRRILAADAQVKSEQEKSAKTNPFTRLALVFFVAVLGLGSFGFYQWLGAPGYPDLPLADRIEAARETKETRVSQLAFEAQLPAPTRPDVDPSFAALVEELRAAVAERPDDLRGLELLARNEATLQNYKAAYAAQERIIALKGEDASSFDHTQLADMMIRAAQGYVSPEAENALRLALAKDPENGFALYYSGLMLSQNGRPDLTFRIWRDLLEAGPEAAPWIAPIRARIADLAWISGVTYTAPEPRGPSASDIEAAQQLAPEDQAAMIEAMVAGLADRLATEGGTPDEWAQLIGAYGVLGQIEQAQAIWAEAQTVFAETPEALAAIARAAEAIGLREQE